MMKHYCIRLGLSQHLSVPAAELAQSLSETTCSNRASDTIYGVSLYIIAMLLWTQRRGRSSKESIHDVVSLLGINRSTIQLAYRDVYFYLSEILPTGPVFYSFSSLPRIVSTDHEREKLEQLFNTKKAN